MREFPFLGFSEEGLVSEGLFNLIRGYAMSELNMKREASAVLISCLHICTILHHELCPSRFPPFVGKS